MGVETLDSLLSQAVASGFRQAVITGGEPLFHRNRASLLAACAAHRGKGSNIVIRTNLHGQLSDAELEALADSADQVVASVDRNRHTHDARRGMSAYASTIRNLERYAAIAAAKPVAAELSLACVMGEADTEGPPGQSVRELAKRLGVARVRFRPLLPLGRAESMLEPVACEGLPESANGAELLAVSFRPLASCGIGQNIFIEPDGSAFPCYAWHGQRTKLGSASKGFEAVLGSEAFSRLIGCTVDTIEGCKACEVRYLCGGACRAWGGQNALDLNAPPPGCRHLKDRAKRLLEAARNYL